MVLYRLKLFFLHLFARLAAWAQSTRTRLTDLAHLLKSAIASSDDPAEEPLEHATSITSSSGLASGRWLDDTRRLRPHLTATAQGWSVREPANNATAQPTPTNTTPLISPASPTSPASSSSASPLPQSTPASRPLEARREQPTRPLHQPPSPASPPQSNPTAPIPHRGHANPQENEERRRLLALRYLVRVGVYNEGFAAGNTPDQYQRSLGMGESAWADDSLDEFDDDLGSFGDFEDFGDFGDTGDAHDNGTPYA